MYLGNGYYIDADRYQYILEKHVISKKGKSEGEEIVTDRTFHPTVHAACEYLLRQMQRNTISEFKGKPESVANEFKAHVKEVSEMFKKVEHLPMGGNNEDNGKEAP